MMRAPRSARVGLECGTVPLMLAEATASKTIVPNGRDDQASFLFKWKSDISSGPDTPKARTGDSESMGTRWRARWISQRR